MSQTVIRSYGGFGRVQVFALEPDNGREEKQALTSIRSTMPFLTFAAAAIAGGSLVALASALPIRKTVAQEAPTSEEKVRPFAQLRPSLSAATDSCALSDRNL